jgi:transcription-repair coupling factor (superfamily II helicase)
MFIELTSFFDNKKLSVNIEEIHYITEYVDNGSKIRFKRVGGEVWYKDFADDVWSKESIVEISNKIKILNTKYGGLIRVFHRES